MKILSKNVTNDNRSEAVIYLREVEGCNVSIEEQLSECYRLARWYKLDINKIYLEQADSNKSGIGKELKKIYEIASKKNCPFSMVIAYSVNHLQANNPMEIWCLNKSRNLRKLKYLFVDDSAFDGINQKKSRKKNNAA